MSHDPAALGLLRDVGSTTALNWFAIAFATVFAAELIGDRSLVATSALAAHFPPVYVFGGLLPAYAAKAGVAVLVGGLLTSVPIRVLAVVSCATYLGSAFLVWRERAASRERTTTASAREGMSASFAAVFFTEWGDVGQITLALLAARSRAPLAVWIGGTAALWTKGLAATLLGFALRRHVRAEWLRVGVVGVCLCFAAGAAFVAVR